MVYTEIEERCKG